MLRNNETRKYNVWIISRDSELQNRYTTTTTTTNNNNNNNNTAAATTNSHIVAVAQNKDKQNDLPNIMAHLRAP